MSCQAVLCKKGLKLGDSNGYYLYIIHKYLIYIYVYIYIFIRIYIYYANTYCVNMIKYEIMYYSYIISDGMKSGNHRVSPNLKDQS